MKSMNRNAKSDADTKAAVHDFWNSASCGEALYMVGDDDRARFRNELQERYRLEPYIIDFADFENVSGKKILEIGVGLGADHQKFAESGAILSGCDLTPRAVEITRKRLELFELSSELQVADAENLPYDDCQFDFVYSWGVIHHSPNTPKAVKEIYRVLRHRGQARVMVYHKYSMVGAMLWARYALMRLRPFTSLDSIYSRYLESPGTKAYSINAAKQLFSHFSDVKIKTVLTHGDLLESDAGQRHRGVYLTIAKSLYPRFIVRKLFSKRGLFMLVWLTK